MSKKVTLSEMMGKSAAGKGSGMSMKDLPEILGDGMPDLDMSPVGRIRLIRALKQRFGDNFRSLPGLKGIVKEFDSAASAAVVREKLKGIKYRGNNG